MKKKIIILISLILIVFTITALLQPKNKPAPSSKNQFNLNNLNSTQLPNDQLYGQALESLHQQYPWYSQLPIETKDFRIIYDFDKKSFRIRLLQPSSPEIKQKALDALKNIGVDLNQFSYYFLQK